MLYCKVAVPFKVLSDSLKVNYIYNVNILDKGLLKKSSDKLLYVLHKINYVVIKGTSGIYY